MGVYRVLELVGGPLHSTSADFTTIFMVKANKTKIVQQVIMPISSQCIVDVTVLEVTLKL